MAVTLEQARTHLNFDADETGDDTELQFMVDAANEWVATQITDVTPKPVQLGTLELVRHFWDTQRGAFGNPLDNEGEFSMGLLGFSVPNRVKELLAPFLDAGTPAALGSFPDAEDWPDAATATGC